MTWPLIDRVVADGQNVVRVATTWVTKEVTFRPADTTVAVVGTTVAVVVFVAADTLKAKAMEARMIGERIFGA